MSQTKAEFDEFAASYEEALNKGISVSGESKEFFAEERVRWLATSLTALGISPVHSILDFGCGTGTAAPVLRDVFAPKTILGVDPSADSIREAQGAFGSFARFATNECQKPDGSFDLCYCNGVFHHIPLAERDEAVRYIFESLRPGGYFGLWENNPWNPGTRYVMSRIPFDRDAITLTPPEAAGLLKKNGFTIVSTSYRFLFPRFLSGLRGLEPPLARLPLGAQYQVLCRKDA